MNGSAVQREMQPAPSIWVEGEFDSRLLNELFPDLFIKQVGPREGRDAVVRNTRLPHAYGVVDRDLDRRLRLGHSTCGIDNDCASCRSAECRQRFATNESLYVTCSTDIEADIIHLPAVVRRALADPIADAQAEVAWNALVYRVTAVAHQLAQLRMYPQRLCKSPSSFDAHRGNFQHVSAVRDISQFRSADSHEINLAGIWEIVKTSPTCRHDGCKEDPCPFSADLDTTNIRQFDIDAITPIRGHDWVHALIDVLERDSLLPNPCTMLRDELQKLPRIAWKVEQINTRLMATISATNRGELGHIWPLVNDLSSLSPSR